MVFRDVATYVKVCDPCQRTGRPIASTRWPLTPILPLAPFEKWGIDFVGPIAPSTQRQKRYILVATDYFTGMLEAEAMRRDDATTVAAFLFEKIVCRYGVPLELVSDRGTHFVNELIEEMVVQYGIKHWKMTSYNPKANGLTKKSNVILCKVLKKVTQAFVHDWHLKLPGVLFAFRTAQKTTTRCMPYYLCHGMEAIMPVELEVPTLWVQEEKRLRVLESVPDQKVELLRLHEEQERVLKQVIQLQGKRKEHYDKKLKKRVDLKAGDLALLYDSRKEHFPGKMSLNWQGPYKVLEVFANGSVQLATMNDEKLETRVNGHRVKKYIT
ncbi:hypothetical protein R1flu_008635 [Riccia fluitans]|uniref:Integrase catalytic domain-containing protein n=1 Tax=Riccia fluitans TaxID=41844 RepID=A0ABD1YCH2_9MARC